MDNKVERHTIIGEVEVHKFPVEIEVPIYKKVEKPDYVLIKEEVVYQVPRVDYEDKTYIKPVLVEKEFIVPVYVEKTYEIPKYIEVEYEIPKIKYVTKEIVHEKPIFEEKVIVRSVEVPVEKPVFIEKEIEVTNVTIIDKQVTNAVIKNVTIEAVHPKYVCSKCQKEPVG